MRTVFAALLVVAATFTAPAVVHACTPEAPLSPTAVLPATEATGVPRSTPIVLRASEEPREVELSVGGEKQNAPSFEAMGRGIFGLGSFWRMRSSEPLAASTEHVMTATVYDPETRHSARREILRFTTSADLDSGEQPQAPLLRTLALTRVHYSKDQIGIGNCVFGESHGFIQLGYEAAVFPTTPAAAVIYSATLTPSDGSSAPQQVLFLGDDLFYGEDPQADYHLPVGRWQPQLEAHKQYCLELAAFGYGGPASAVGSAPMCATPAELDAATPASDSAGCSSCGSASAAAILMVGLGLVSGRRR